MSVCGEGGGRGRKRKSCLHCKTPNSIYLRKSTFQSNPSSHKHPLLYTSPQFIPSHTHRGRAHASILYSTTIGPLISESTFALVQPIYLGHDLCSRLVCIVIYASEVKKDVPNFLLVLFSLVSLTGLPDLRISGTNCKHSVFFPYSYMV